jgi:uncharacterized protein YggE
MKKTTILLLALSALLAPLAHAQTITSDAGIPKVTVYGTAKAQAKPDLLRWSISVEDKGYVLSEISSAHTARTATVLRFLKEKSIDQKETQTSGMRFSEVWKWISNSQVKDGYSATTQITFTMQNLDDYQAVWLGLAGIQGVSVRSVNWDVSNRIEIQNETRKNALKAAREKALQMAAALDSKIAEPLAIEEVLTDDARFYAGNQMSNNAIFMTDAQGGSGEFIAPGTIDISTRIRVVFRLLTP